MMATLVSIHCVQEILMLSQLLSLCEKWPEPVVAADLLPSATKLRRLCFYRRLSVHGGVGVSASVHAGISHPPEQTPPRSRPPRADTHPPVADTPLGADTLLGADTPREQKPPPGADTPPEADPPPRDTVTASDGTHPTGMHSCFRNDFACLQYWQHI